MTHTVGLRWFPAGALALLLTVAPGGWTLENRSSFAVSGTVLGSEGPLGRATVRIQATNHFTVTRADGSFTLTFGDLGKGPLNLTAWAEGYYCAGPVSARAGDHNLRIQLIQYPSGDHQEYRWRPAEVEGDVEDAESCASCHGRGSDLSIDLPFDEWRLDAHSSSAVNPRFLTMYLGTDLAGRKSPLTRRFADKDYGTMPLPPDSDTPFFGPGYRLDFPDSAGNCAACHVPMAAVDAPYETDPSVISGVAAEGISCDFCHKVREVVVDPSTDRPYPDRPGVLSYRLNRPPPGHQFFAGPFDDVAPGEDTYSAVQKESLYCAPCHFGSFWGTEIYNSYGEWLESPYSLPATGRTCQDCHMPSSDAEFFARPDRGGIRRSESRIASHRMPGAADVELLTNAVTMTLAGSQHGDVLSVGIEIRNDRTGHHVPTDSPLRHLILLVGASDSKGVSLEQVRGPVLPDWVGVGRDADGNYAGQPGKVFAKVLSEEWTGVSPTAAYWNPTRVVSDNRIPAFGSDSTTIEFATTGRGPYSVHARLLFRRAYRELARQKGWTDPDIVMEEEEILISAELENPGS